MKRILMTLITAILFFSGCVFASSGSLWGESLVKHTIPTNHFRVYYLNTNDTTKAIATEEVKKASVQYIYNDFKGIPSEDFGAFYIGEFYFEAGNYDFNIAKSWSDVRVYIDGKLVYLNDGFKVTKAMTKGKHTIEIEYLNNWHTTNFAFSFNPSKSDKNELPVSALVQDYWGTADFVDINIYEPDSFKNEIQLTLDNYDKPIVLFLRSYNTVNWVINNPHQVKIDKVILGSYYTTSTVESSTGTPLPHDFVSGFWYTSTDPKQIKEPGIYDWADYQYFGYDADKIIIDFKNRVTHKGLNPYIPSQKTIPSTNTTTTTTTPTNAASVQAPSSQAPSSQADSSMSNKMISASALLLQYKIISGDSQGNLNEDLYLNRAELAKLLCQLNKVSDTELRASNTQKFKDINKSAWYAPYINYCNAKGWLKGSSPSEFNPNSVVSQEMMSAVLLRLLDYKPVWGMATTTLNALLEVHVPVTTPNRITRGEAFKYIAGTLKLNHSSKNSLLETVLGYTSTSSDTNSPASFVGFTRPAGGYFTFVDGNGDPVPYSRAKIAPSDKNQLFQVDYSTFLLFESSGKLVDANPFWFGNRYSEGATDSVKTYQTLKNDRMVLVVDQDYKIIAKVPSTLYKGYRLKEATQNYLIVTDESLKTDYLLTLKGTMVAPLADKGAALKGSQQNPIEIVALNSKYLYIQDSQHKYLYDFQNRTLISPIALATDLKMISTDELLITGIDIKLANLRTKTTFTLDPKHKIPWIDWTYGEPAAAAFSETAGYKVGIDKTLKVTNFGNYTVNHLVGNIFSITSKAYELGIVTSSGKVLIKPSTNIWWNIGRTIQVDGEEDALVSSNGRVISLANKDLTYNEYYNFIKINHQYYDMDLNEIASAKIGGILKRFTNGYYYHLSNTYEQTICKPNGQVFIRGYFKAVDYSHGQQVFVYQGDRDYSVVDLKGYKISLFRQYKRIESAGKYLQAYDGDFTYLLDKEGTRIVTPIKGNITFFIP